MLKSRKKTALLYKYDSAMLVQLQQDLKDASAEDAVSSSDVPNIAADERFSTEELKDFIETRSRRGSGVVSAICNVMSVSLCQYT